jgi:hypothetical protein
MPPEIPLFQQHQLAFTAHIRNPEQAPPPNTIEPRRMNIYRELFYNGMESHLATNFPVLCRIMSDTQWRTLVRDFFIQHRCRTGLFTQIGLEFVTYLEQQRISRPDDFPFMLELAHYEYAELAVSISAATETRAYDPEGDLLIGSPVLAPTVWNLSYQYPVQRIGPDYLPETPPEQLTHLVVYRDQQDKVRFLEINAVTQQLLNILCANSGITGQSLLEAIVQAIQPQNPAPIFQAGAVLLTELRERNILLGSYRPR